MVCSSLSAKMVFGKATAASPAGTQPTLGLTALRLGLRRARVRYHPFEGEERLFVLFFVSSLLER